MKYLEALSLAKKASDTSSTKGPGRKNRPGPAEDKAAPPPKEAETLDPEVKEPKTVTDLADSPTSTEPTTTGKGDTTGDDPEKSEKSTKGRKSDK